MIPFNRFISSGPRAGVVRGPMRGGYGGLRGACGDMAAVGEVLTADPRTRDAAGGLKVVPTVWIQRAVNGLLAFTRIPGVAPLVVDGIAGPATLNAVKRVRLWDLSRLHPIPSDPSYTAMPTILDAEHMTMAAHTHAAMNNVMRVADPVGSTVGMCSWSRAAQIVPDAPSDRTVDPSSDAMVPASSWTDSGTIEAIVVPAVAFLAAAALGVVLVKVAAPKRGRR